MVAEQLVPRGISDERVLEAMRTVRRHEFMPEDVRDLAYVDSPVRIGHGLHTVDIPFSGWWALPVFAAVLLARQRDQLLLLIFFVPTSLTALLVFSGRGITNATAFNHVAFALLLCWLIHLATAIVPGVRRTVGTGAGKNAAGNAGGNAGGNGVGRIGGGGEESIV